MRSSFFIEALLTAPTFSSTRRSLKITSRSQSVTLKTGETCCGSSTPDESNTYLLPRRLQALLPVPGESAYCLSYQSDDRSSPMPLHDRLYYLAQALTSAKSAASLGSEDVEFTSRLQEQIDVAQVQMEVAHAVEVHPEMTGEEKVEILASLNDGLLQLDEVSVDNS